ncbi:hypothetical protein [Microvirga antarctica]|uniref:hypothetical protein n=1 Tax=Microvirga antarctica TaxID=2819233 RepID=UPI001B312AA7|nr:hypothetical protein [Microvirga antarctica]
MSKQLEIIRLCDEVIGGFDLHSLESIINKSHHIAELTGNSAACEFLYCESAGYYQHGHGRQDEFLNKTHRHHVETNTWILAPAALLERDSNGAKEAVSKLELKSITSPLSFQSAIADEIIKLSKIVMHNNTIIHHVRRLTYQIISNTRANIIFSKESADIFAHYQGLVDAKISSTANEAFSKLPSVFERLSAGDGEAISHALTSCRRIIDAFAVAIFPPQGDPVDMGDHTIQCGPGKSMNQIQAYIWKKTFSKSRRDRLNKNMRSLYDRTSAGVHAEVSPTEAQALVLNTYLLLGEIVDLR